MQLWQSLLSHLLVLEEARVVLAGEEGNESRMLLALLTSFLGEQIQQLSVCVYVCVHMCYAQYQVQVVYMYTCMYMYLPPPTHTCTCICTCSHMMQLVYYI